MLRLVFAWFTLLDRRLVESAPRYFPDIGKSLAYIVLRRQALGRGVAASALRCLNTGSKPIRPAKSRADRVRGAGSLPRDNRKPGASAKCNDASR
jgi:hypothetical protein